MSENIGESVRKYEGKVVTSYGEHGRQGLGVENWGTIIALDGSRFNCYTDESYIRSVFTDPLLQFIETGVKQPVLADLGGDNGFLLNMVLGQVKEKKPDISPLGLIVDLDSTGKASRSFRQSQKRNEGLYTDLNFVQGDITKLPLGDNTVDFAISRMTMQYLNKEQQNEFMQEVGRVLKSNGECVLLSPTSLVDHDVFNIIWKKITVEISGSADFDRAFPDFNKFSIHKQFEQKYGLRPIFGSRADLFPVSVNAFTERFNVDPESLSRLFLEESQGHPEQFHKIDGHQCLMMKLLLVRLKKV